MYYIITDDGRNQPQVLGRYGTEDEALAILPYWRKKAGKVSLHIVRTV